VIVERLAAMPLLAGERPDPPGVYRALMAMESCGLVRSEWDLSERGPARRVYSLTPAGGECVFRWAETLRRYHASLGALIRLVERAASGKPCGTCCGKRGGR
jgi:DNA-binding PadR family transcriptional regulator